MVNHYEVHVIFQDIEHQLEKNILHHFPRYTFFYEIFIKLKSIFDPLQVIYWKLFATLTNHINYLHPNIEDMTILYFYHDISCICH